MQKQQFLDRLEKQWAALKDSYAGLSEAQMQQEGVAGDWSIKDILAHVTTWEEESLAHLPTILAGKTPPRYSVTHGGIDAFNAKRTEEKRRLSLVQVLDQFDDVHSQLVEYIQGAPEELFTRETRFRRRLRLDTYSHYPAHAEAIRAWREVEAQLG
jgi:hypothetical protein